jgi:cytochrome c peroxidase
MPRLLSTLSVLSLLAACSSKTAQAKGDPMQAPLGLANAKLTVKDDNPPTAAKIELGKQLFFDNRLSGSGKMSCSTCHLPEQAFTDGRAHSTKDDGKENSRNAPTMFNVGYHDRLYWDGRAKGLEANVLAAWKGQIGGKPEEVAKALAAVPEYGKAFQDAFGGPPSETTIVHALSSFLRTLRSGNSPYDRWQAGDQKAVSDAAKQGFELFRGKAGCFLCHHPLPDGLFTDRQFHNTGIGMSAEKPDVGAAAKVAFDDETKTGAFKTPSLRDVAKTAPYFHDGSVKTLREAVVLMSKGGLDNKHKDPLLQPKELSDAEIDQLVAFFESLSGDVPWTAPAVPK